MDISLTCFDLSEVKVINEDKVISRSTCLTFYRQVGGGPSTERHPCFDSKIDLNFDWSFVSKDLYLVITLNLINLHVLADCPLQSQRPRNG